MENRSPPAKREMQHHRMFYFIALYYKRSASKFSEARETSGTWKIEIFLVLSGSKDYILGGKLKETGL